MQQFKAAVTFESLTLAPKTARVEVAAGSVGRAADLAVREAAKVFPMTRWSSVVILIEKSGTSPALSAENGHSEEPSDGQEPV